MPDKIPSIPPQAAPPAESGGALTRAVVLLAALATLVALRLGSDVLIPVAMALLVTFLLHPMVGWIARRTRLPRPAACAVTLVLTGVTVAGIGWLMTSQFLDLTARLPDYHENLRDKARSLRAASGGSGTIERLSGTLREIKEELSATRPATRPEDSSTSREPGAGRVASMLYNSPTFTAAVALAQVRFTRDPPTVPTTMPASGQIDAPNGHSVPMRVQLVEEGGAWATIGTFAPKLLFPIAQIGVVIILVTFLLLYSDDVRDRLVWLAGKRQISLTTAALDEMGTRIGGYLRMSLIVNVCYGVMVGIGLALIGVPNAALWGLLGVFLRFIPFAGPWIAAILPTLLAIAVFPGWARPMSVIGMFVVIEFITNMILEPWLWGGSSGLSTLGVVVAAVFWSWLWGPVGLLLAVPITVCLVVIGKHLPQLAFIHHLFGRDKSIPAVSRLYQRLLVGDEDTAAEIVRHGRAQRTFVETCDHLFLPVLHDLKRDYSTGAINRWQVHNALIVLERLAQPAEGEESCAEVGATTVETNGTLLIASTQNEIDDAAAALLARAAESMGIQTEISSSRALVNEIAHRMKEIGATMAVVVQVAPISWRHSRHVLKALLRAARGEGGGRLIDLAIEPLDDAAPTPADQLGVRRERSFEPVLRRACELGQVRRSRGEEVKPDEPGREPSRLAAPPAATL